MHATRNANQFEPDDVYVIDTHEKLRVLANPLRLQILESITEQARTAKEIGDLIGVQSNTRYYHLAELEKAGMIKVVDTVITSGIQQKYYRATGRFLRLELSLLHGIQTPGSTDPAVAFIVGAIERTARELLRSFEHGVTEQAMDLTRVARRTTRTTAEKAAAFKTQLNELESEFTALSDSDGDVTLEFGFALFPHADSNSTDATSSANNPGDVAKREGGSVTTDLNHGL